jgi:transcriptional regulator of acetoin/glycerol metabolism
VAATRGSTRPRLATVGEMRSINGNREKERMDGALRACNWNRVKAAAMMGLPRRTFYRRLNG